MNPTQSDLTLLMLRTKSIMQSLTLSIRSAKLLHAELQGLLYHFRRAIERDSEWNDNLPGSIGPHCDD